MQEVVQETSIDMARAMVKIETLADDFKEIKETLKELVRHADVKEMTTRIIELEKRVESLTTWRNMILGGFAVVSFIFSLVIALGFLSKDDVVEPQQHQQQRTSGGRQHQQQQQQIPETDDQNWGPA